MQSTTVVISHSHSTRKSLLSDSRNFSTRNMLLRASPATSFSCSSPPSSSSGVRCPPCSLVFSLTSRSSTPLRVSAAIAPEQKSLTGVVFEPFVEVQSQLAKVSPITSQSLARQNYSAACEAAINEQINVEYNTSYVYHALFAYFDRDNVALPGFAKFFKESSDEERMHAEKLMRYQNMRGGKVKLQSIVMPSVTEFDDQDKGDALCAMELTLALERLVNEKLLQLYKVAEEEGDPQLSDFIEGEFLKPQVEDIKKVSEYVSQLRRVGKGHGVYHFDLIFQGKEA